MNPHAKARKDKFSRGVISSLVSELRPTTPHLNHPRQKPRNSTGSPIPLARFSLREPALSQLSPDRVRFSTAFRIPVFPLLGSVALPGDPGSRREEIIDPKLSQIALRFPPPKARKSPFVDTLSRLLSSFLRGAYCFKGHPWA